MVLSFTLKGTIPVLKSAAVTKVKAEKLAVPPIRDKYFSRAVSKALEVLEFLQVESTALQMNDIAERLRLSKTSTFRLLRTLETLGYVTADGRGRYVLSPAIHAVTPTQWVGKLVRVATPHLHDLNMDLSETATLAALFDNRVEVVAVVESPHVIRMSNILGSILPPNASSLGKVIAAFQAPDQREKLLRSFKIYRFTDHTITDQKELGHEFDRILLQKFAIDREECTYDGICFSVPVFEVGGQVSAAMSMSLPKSRLKDAKHEALIIEALKASAARVTADLHEAR
jgi:DNA-binding IclR family transcriptional regulator